MGCIGESTPWKVKLFGESDMCTQTRDEFHGLCVLI